MKKLTLTLCLGLAVILALPAAGLAAADDTQAILRELKALKAKIAELEPLKAQVKELEARLEKADKQQAAQAQAAAKKKSDSSLKIGGAVRLNYAVNSFSDASKDRGGDLGFELFRINAKGNYKDILFDAEYRFYQYMDVVHHGWIGYRFSEDLHAELGVNQVPFGLLPYASHNWWFGLGYYTGLEDDYDAGLKLVYKSGPLDIQGAFYKNAEWASGSVTDRYSIDVVKAMDQANEEVNQFNGRVAYTLDHGKLGSTEFGLSGQWGQLYNAATEENGSHYAYAAHINGNYWRFNLQLQAARYSYDAENPDSVTAADGTITPVNDDVVIMGAFGGSWQVAAEGTLYTANLAYTQPVGWGPIDSVTLYNDFSWLSKDNEDFHDSYINTLGVLIASGPVYTYIDYIWGKNALWLGGANDPLAMGEEDADWEQRFNINVGYYF